MHTKLKKCVVILASGTLIMLEGYSPDHEEVLKKIDRKYVHYELIYGPPIGQVNIVNVSSGWNL